jgi:hypothetical protein
MTADHNSRQLEIHTNPVVVGETAKNTDGLISDEIFKLLLFTLLLSAVSSILAIFVAIITRQNSKAEDKKKEQTEKNIKKELAELHKEIALLKGDCGAHYIQ